MKKTIIFLSIFFTALCAYAGKSPFTNDYANQIALNIGQGVNNGFLIPPPSQPVPFYLVNIQYSQPTTFFKIPARQSISLAQTIGVGKRYGWSWNDYSIPIIYLSEDIALLSRKNWYFGTGIGVGLQAQQNERIGSKLLFHFKLFFGYKLNDQLAMEFLMQHFSNANTAFENHAYAFYGLGTTYNF